MNLEMIRFEQSIEFDLKDMASYRNKVKYASKNLLNFSVKTCNFCGNVDCLQISEIDV
jgi:hypothetical protein